MVVSVSSRHRYVVACVSLRVFCVCVFMVTCSMEHDVSILLATMISTSCARAHGLSHERLFGPLVKLIITSAEEMLLKVSEKRLTREAFEPNFGHVQ